MRGPKSDSARPEAQNAGTSWPVQLALGFGYWLVVLLLLEPGNVLEVSRGGLHLPWREEVVRIGGAALLGAAVTPLLFQLSRRWPVEGPAWRGHLMLQVAAVFALALALIALAQAASGLVLPGRHPALRAPLAVEIASNGALLTLALAAFLAVLHAARFRRRAEAERQAADAARRPAFPDDHVSVKTRGGVLRVPLEQVEWVESQGNYLALHAGGKAHLLRETLAAFERRLDPAVFVRVHRRTIVRAECVRRLTHLSNGDALLTLEDGTDLRLSRSYRDGAQRLFALRAPASSP